MSNLPLGEILDDKNLVYPDGFRDAIHVAVIPVISADTLRPGDHVGLVVKPPIAFHRVAKNAPRLVGVVDPFLPPETVIQPHQRFFLFLYPNTITSLNHHWTHPAFEDQSPESVSVAWIKQFAEKIDQTYNKLMSAAENYIDYGDYMMDNTQSYDAATSEDWKMFWKHYQNLTGKAPDNGEAYAPFSCAC